MLFHGEGRIGGDLQGRGRTAEGRAAPGGEKNELRAGGGERGGRDQVVARRAQQVQAGDRDALRVAEDALHGGRAGLLCAAESLVLESRDAARLVARRGVLVHRHMAALKIALEVVDQAHGLSKQLFGAAAGHEDGLRAEHLRDLGQDGASAHRGQQVGEHADGGVRGDAGQAVRAAALEAHDQLVRRTGHAFIPAHPRRQFADQTDPFSQFIFHVLADQEADAALVVFAHVRSDLLNAAVFAAEAQQQHAARIRVNREIGKRLSRVLLVQSHLGAAVGMRESIHAVDAPADVILRHGGQGLRHVVHAADRRDDPQLIADAGAVVRTRIAHEGARREMSLRHFDRVPGVFQFAGKQRLQVVRMHMRARGNVRQRFADRIAVLDDRLACADVPEGGLVPHGQVVQQGDFPAAIRRSLPRLQRFQRDCDHVTGGDLQESVHALTSCRGETPARPE